ncbi:MAG: CehA/McbA family metallohydrolase [Planctomycetes bacterium]|nr:CehA/McbA family metallohydrolase [Planctomycetota bacterium]
MRDARLCLWNALFAAIAAIALTSDLRAAGLLIGTVVDAETKRPTPSRVSIRRDDGAWFFARSASPDGSAVEYRRQRGSESPIAEMHVTLSAHPFRADLPPGKYAISVERGKEYAPASIAVELGADPVRLTIPLRRWIDMAARGWYSGDTHVHRSLEELPNVMLAEDLNVAYPLVYWVTRSGTPPGQGDRSARGAVRPDPIAIDATHVIVPLNTEYEIFTVGGKPHTLGAFFIIDHDTVFETGVPPVRAIAERAHREGALLELDKHCWPWSMAIVPIARIDLYELANNHHWRVPFGFPEFGEPAAPYMRIERDARGWTERGWTEYGFQNYYALLDCGFRLRPTAGTASGVHPVPLGFGRVYVKIDGPFSAEAWKEGLAAGRSFVTTGPMLFARVEREAGRVRVTGSAIGEGPLARIEIVVNGEVARAVEPANREGERGGRESPFDERVPIAGSSWVAVRCFEDRPEGRIRFAHTAPVFIDIEGKPLRPRREEIAYLIARVEAEIARSEGVLPPAAIDEYREALEIYRAIRAR